MPETGFERTPALARISDYPFHYARQQPEADAICAGSLVIDFATFAAQIDRCARALLAAGVRRGDRVAMLTTPRPEYLVLFMATVRIGAIWLGVSPRYRTDEIAYVLGDARPMVLVTIGSFEQRDYLPDLAGLPAELLDSLTLVVLGPAPGLLKSSTWDEFLAAAAGTDAATLDTAAAAVGATDPALIVYTSGSTGQAKGALLSHRGIVTSTRIQCEHWWAEPFRILNNMPINHVGGAVQIGCQAIVAGGANILMERFDPAGTSAVIERERVTVLHQVSTMYQLMLDKGEVDAHDLSSLQLLIWSGAPASQDLVRRLRRLVPRLYTSYGSTEVGGEVLYSSEDADDQALAETVGAPDPRIPVRVADEHSICVPDGQTGEIQARGDTVMLGYFNRPDDTRQVLTADGWIRTGDLGQIDPHGQFRLVGRLKEMFKSGGYNVYPREIEQVIESHPAVSTAAVVSVPDPLYQEVGIAFVLLEPGKSVTAEEVRAHCRGRLANYKVPKHIEVCDALPMLPIGKVDRAELRNRVRRAIASGGET